LVLNGANLEVVCSESSSKGGGQLPNMLDGVTILVEGENLATFAQEMDQVTPIPASSVKHTHPRGDVPTKDLIEDVDVNVSKLLLNA
jgi:hypothetical protein